MALSLAIIGAAGNNPSSAFVAQCQAALQATVTAVLGEAIGADYVVRRKFAQKCALSIQSSALQLAVAIANQIQAANPTKYTDLTNIQDADVTTALSGIFTQQAYASILPS